MINWFESIVYGILSGFAEIFPVSLQAHQAILQSLFGVDSRIPALDFFVHIGILIAILVASREQIGIMRRERMLLSKRKPGRRAVSGVRSAYDTRLIKTAAVPMVILLFLRVITVSLEQNSILLCFFFILNGIMLLTADHLRQANKDARNMSGIDAMLIGVAGAFSVISGLSRMGFSLSTASMRGAERSKALNWCLFLGIPAMAVAGILDLAGAFSTGFGIQSAGEMLLCVLSGLFSFISAYFGIWIFRRSIVRTDFSFFTYYSFGASLFVFTLYLVA